MLYPKQKITRGHEYFAFTLTDNACGGIAIDAQTVWVGFADVDKLVELREPSTVQPERMADYWIEFDMPFCVVNTSEDFRDWFVTGGHALVSKDIAINNFPDAMKPSPCVKTGKLGFNDMKTLPDTIFRKAPTPKVRMSILKRDKYRCRICGRSPSNHEDIELHVHHITPFGQHGVTREDNLITLCHTCHKGLEPHREWSLYDLIESSGEDNLKIRRRREYLNEVRQYQEFIQKKLDETKQTEQGQSSRSLRSG
ncbi:MAG: HNH endonuclease [Methanobacteriota archaeon]